VLALINTKLFPRFSNTDVEKSAFPTVEKDRCDFHPGYWVQLFNSNNEFLKIHKIDICTSAISLLKITSSKNSQHYSKRCLIFFYGKMQLPLHSRVAD